MRIKFVACSLLALSGSLIGCGSPDAQGGSLADTPVSQVVTPPPSDSVPALETYGQLIYVPAYSHIYHVRQDRDFQLTVTLSIRNPFPWRSITINRVDYFNSAGQFVRGYLHDTMTLAPMETLEFVVDQNDESGGSGANFLIGWEGSEEDAGPIAEAVMIGTASGQGLSFVTTGTRIRRD